MGFSRDVQEPRSRSTSLRYVAAGFAALTGAALPGRSAGDFDFSSIYRLRAGPQLRKRLATAGDEVPGRSVTDRPRAPARITLPASDPGEAPDAQGSAFSLRREPPPSPPFTNSGAVSRKRR